MAIPANFSTGRVTGQFIVGVADGPDDDDEPDFIPAAGVVAFTASTPYLPHPAADPNPVTMLKTTILAILDSEGYICTPRPDNPTVAGRRGIRLVATDDAGASVEGWTWNATPQFVDVNGSVIHDAIRTFNFALPAGSTVDLTTVVKVPASQGIGTEQAVAALALAKEAAESAAGSAEVALATAMDVKRRADDGEFQGRDGEAGPAGPNTVPTQEAVANYATTPGNPVNEAVVATAVRSTNSSLNGARTVFDGDSITESFSPGENLAGAWGIHAVLSSGGKINPVFNAAHGGYTSAQLQALFVSEVISQRPTLVIMKPGRNDDAENGMAQTKAFVEFALDECRKIGAELVLINATPQGNSPLTVGGAPTVSVATATGGTIPAGTHRYQVTYTNASGETTPTPAGEVTTTNNTSRIKVDIPHIPGATGAKIYKATGGGGGLYTNYSTGHSWQYLGLPQTAIAGTGGTAANSRPEDGGKVGTQYLRTTWSKGTTDASGGSLSGPSHSFPALSVLTFGVSVRPSRTQRIQLRVRWRNEAGLLGSEMGGITEVLPGGVWTDMKWTATAPAGATRADVTVQAIVGDSGVNWEAGDTLDRDAEYITDGDIGFFDGDNGGSWSGAAGSSTSTKGQASVEAFGLVGTITPTSSPGYSFWHIYNEQSPATPDLSKRPPSTNTTGSATSRNKQAARLNAWLTRFGAKNGLIVVDVYKELVDPTTGFWKPGYTYDGTHPTGEANKVIGQSVAAALESSLKPAATLTTASALDPLNLFSNGLLLEGSGSRPAGASISLSPSYQTNNHTETRAPRKGYMGNAYTLARQGGGTATTTFPAITSGFSPGDRLLFGFVSDTQGMAANGSYAVWRWIDQAGATVARYAVANADHGTTPLTFERTIGAGVTSLRFTLELIGKGEASVGQLFVYNLTAESYL